MASEKANKTEENNSVVRKSILRYPEVPSTCIEHSNKHVSINDYRSNYIDYHDLSKPQINKLGDMRKTLKEIQRYEARELTSLDDLNKKTQDFINRTVSSKLNFHSTQSVFKNLPSLNDNQTNRLPKQPKRVDNSGKADKRENIISHIKQMIDIESKIKEGKENEKQHVINLPGEEEFLGLGKVDSKLLTSNRKFEHKNYRDTFSKEFFEFCTDHYLSKNARFEPILLNRDDGQKINDKKSCECLNDFYLQHSACS